MKSRLAILGILLIALMAVLFMKGDNVFRPEVESTTIPRERVEPPFRWPTEKKEKRAQPGEQPRKRETSAVQATEVPEEEPVTAPTGMIPAATEPTAPVTPVPAETKKERAESTAQLPYYWTSPAKEESPAFVDPNRDPVQVPSGDPILSRPKPSGPRGLYYDEEDRFDETTPP